MAGFVPEPRRYRLRFEDPALEGLEVLARSVTVGEFMKVSGLDEADVLTGVSLSGQPPPSMLKAFADAVVEWNLGPDGAPLPISLKTMRAQEIWVARAMVKAWLEGLTGVDPTSKAPSFNGASSAPPPGMDTASQSLQN